MGSTLEFLKAALKNPLQLSTVFETSPWLSAMLLKRLPLEDANLVVELGPGAGAVTAPLLARIPKDCRYIGIELNTHLVHYLHKHYPNRDFIEGSAEQVADIAKKYGPTDMVISSLPWTLFGPEIQGNIMKGVIEALRPGGYFATYVCLNASIYPSAANLKRLLFENFSDIHKSSVEWRNLPPAFVYTCRK